jgi:hypothetical protein
MNVFSGLLDRIVLVCATVAGGCLPSFVLQYRQRLGGRLDQVVADLAPFRAIAERLHGGSLQALIQHHLASTDATFHAEGQAIQQMVDAETRLRGMLTSLQGSVLDQIHYLATHLDHDIARSTWESFVPAFTLDVPSVGIAVGTGLACWLLFIGVWKGIAALVRPGVKRPPPSPRVRREPGMR